MWKRFIRSLVDYQIEVLDEELEMLPKTQEKQKSLRLTLSRYSFWEWPSVFKLQLRGCPLWRLLFGTTKGAFSKSRCVRSYTYFTELLEKSNSV